MIEPPMVQATTRMTVILEAQQWHVVLSFLGKIPYENVVQYIDAIREQLGQQQMAQGEPARPNGGISAV